MAAAGGPNPRSEQLLPRRIQPRHLLFLPHRRQAWSERRRLRLLRNPRPGQKDGGSLTVGRIAIQSLCALQCGYFEKDWDMVSFIRSVKAMKQSSNSITVITFPSTVLSNPFRKRWQHLADTLLLIKAIPDEDKDLAKLLTGYQDMVGFLHVHKVAQTNSQVPVILEASTLSLKLRKRRSLVLERLNQATVDGSSGPSSAASGSCSSSQGSQLDF